MSGRNLISIIVPVYRVPYSLLKRCIESILLQTYRYFELILVDDGSPDDCGSILDQYKKKDSRITVIHKSNGGVSSARNTGIKEANGEFLTFVDADDYVTQNYLCDLYDGIHDNNVDLAKCSCVHSKDGISYSSSNTGCNLKNFKVVSKNEALEYLYYSRAPFDEMEVTAVWGTIYKTSIVKKTEFKSYVIGEDLIFMHEYLQQISTVVYISSKDYIYSDNDGSAMHKQYSDDQIFLTVSGLVNEVEETNCHNVTGFKSRILNTLLTIYMRLNTNAIQSRAVIRQSIINYRNSVLRDKNIKLKLRIALILSIFGLDFVKKLLLLINRKNK